MTAQKRSERIRDVPLSITAASGEQLSKQGITDTSQLAKIVSGFTYQASAWGNPVFAIRGVGFDNRALGSDPAVATYIDQVPLPYSIITRGAGLDLERIEVLKGPQGTLFGQNSTGGAINYIAAKPTKDLKAGFDINYGSFNDIDTTAFLSGPITNSLTARLAVRHEYADGWQYSITRPRDRLGNKDFAQARLLLNWTPTDKLHFELNLSGWRDRGESQAAQFQAFTPSVPVTPVTQNVYDSLSISPVAPNKARAADWDPNVDFRRDSKFYLASLRGDLDLTSDITLTSITAYSRFKGNEPFDSDGSAFNDFRADVQQALLTSFSQELRLSGKSGPLRWMVGGNYQRQVANQYDAFQQNSTQNQLFGSILFTRTGLTVNQKPKTKSGFASAEYAVTDTVTLQASGRYTDQRRAFSGCLSDAGAGPTGVSAGTAFSVLSGILSGTPTTIPPGGCVSLDATTLKPGLAQSNLNEHNFSWRGGISWKPNTDMMLYANIAKGYKSGSYTIAPAVLQQQFTPVTQESVVAYEVGFKQSLADRKVDLTGALFYYDYTNKQLEGTAIFPIFGSLPALINIPKSHILGAEFSTTLRPFSGFTATGGVTYVHSKVTADPQSPYSAFDPFGNPTTFVGESFTNTPKWQANADAEYGIQATGSLGAFIGGTAVYRSKATAAFVGNPPPVAIDGLFNVPGYLILDGRIGVNDADDKWRAQLWVRNITNKYYWVGVTRVIDTVDRIAGMPRTFGVSFSYRM